MHQNMYRSFKHFYPSSSSSPRIGSTRFCRGKQQLASDITCTAREGRRRNDKDWGYGGREECFSHSPSLPPPLAYPDVQVQGRHMNKLLPRSIDADGMTEMQTLPPPRPAIIPPQSMPLAPPATLANTQQHVFSRAFYPRFSLYRYESPLWGKV